MKPEPTIVRPDGTTAHFCHVHGSHFSPKHFYPSDLRSRQNICIACRTARRKQRGGDRKRRLLSNLKLTARRHGIAGVARWELCDVDAALAGVSDADLRTMCLRVKNPTSAVWTPKDIEVVPKSKAKRVRRLKAAGDEPVVRLSRAATSCVLMTGIKSSACC